SSGDQKCDHGVCEGGSTAARESPAGAEWHSGGESPRRTLEPVRVSESGDARRSKGVATFRRAGAESGRGITPSACPGSATLYFAPDQATSGARITREDRADDFLRAGRSAAETVRRAARPLSSLPDGAH